MDAGLIARRYATVLHDFAADRGKLPQVYADARVVRQALANTPEAAQFFESPLRKPAQKRELIKAAFQGRLADETLQFLNFLVDKERISLVGSIMLVFELLYKRQNNICTARVTTARELSAQRQQSLTAQIADKMRQAGRNVAQIDASFRVDPAIIGGVILEVDGMQADGSVLTRLKKIEKQLTV